MRCDCVMEARTVSVSVVIPMYNSAAFVDGLVQRLSEQTFREFEVIVVNDGSQDDTAVKLEALLEQQLPFALTVIHQENGGVSAARNAGLRAARGEYICFLDADDTISRDYLEILFRAVTSTGKRVAVAYMTRDINDLTNHEAVDTRIFSSEEFLREFLYHGIKYTICACMIARQCYLDYALEFPVGYGYSEDVYLLWQLFAKEEEIVQVPCKIYFYYDNPHSAMNAGIDLRRQQAIELMKKLEPIISQSRPAFAKEFCSFVVARHHWSILWQASARLDNYKKFRAYCGNFAMRRELKKLLNYPEARIRLSSFAYLVCPWIYYHLLRAFVKMKNAV